LLRKKSEAMGVSGRLTNVLPGRHHGETGGGEEEQTDVDKIETVEGACQHRRALRGAWGEGEYGLEPRPLQLGWVKTIIRG